MPTGGREREPLLEDGLYGDQVPARQVWRVVHRPRLGVGGTCHRDANSHKQSQVNLGSHALYGGKEPIEGKVQALVGNGGGVEPVVQVPIPVHQGDPDQGPAQIGGQSKACHRVYRRFSNRLRKNGVCSPDRSGLPVRLRRMRACPEPVEGVSLRYNFFLLPGQACPDPP